MSQREQFTLTSGGCKCGSCRLTNSHGAFATWPRGDPAGERSSAAAYSAHVAFSRQGVSKTVQFKPGQPPKYPAWCTPRAPEPRLRIPEGFAEVADYIEEFESLNKLMTPEIVAERERYRLEMVEAEQAAIRREAELDRLRAAKKQSPARSRAARAASPAKEPQHFPTLRRQRKAVLLYSTMPGRQSAATDRALSLIGQPRKAGGVHTPYSAAKTAGIALSTIYRVLKKRHPNQPGAAP